MTKGTITSLILWGPTVCRMPYLDTLNTFSYQWDNTLNLRLLCNTHSASLWEIIMKAGRRLWNFWHRHSNVSFCLSSLLPSSNPLTFLGCYCMGLVVCSAVPTRSTKLRSSRKSLIVEKLQWGVGRRMVLFSTFFEIHRPLHEIGRMGCNSSVNCLMTKKLADLCTSPSFFHSPSHWLIHFFIQTFAIPITGDAWCRIMDVSNWMRILSSRAPGLRDKMTCRGPALTTS